MRVLIVDDTPGRFGLLLGQLQSAGVLVDRSDDEDDALSCLQHSDYDIVLVSLDDDIDGCALIRRMRARACIVPVVAGSTLGSLDLHLRAFGAGADDVVQLPTHGRELLARMRAIVRRAEGHAQPVLTLGPLSLNLDSHQVTVHGRPVHLTGKEYGILELLVRRQGMVLTKEAFLNHLYGGMDEPAMKIIDVFVCKLRKKLADAGAPGIIRTSWGRGYVTRPEAQEAYRPASVHLPAVGAAA